jgi:iron(III) transport system ATP-binding protein
MLSVERLTKIYAQRAGQPGGGIREASFELRPGAFFTLLGPSGCGKTTTLRCIAGLERPDAGAIHLAERPVFNAESRVNVPMNERGIGMVFQSYAIWPHMDVFENVAFPLRARRTFAREEIRRRVEDALARVNLAGYGARASTTLSGGEQQRVALARAIVAEPKLLLLDEPLSNLDAGLREEMRSELSRLQRTIGITTVYVTHDQTEALTLSDQIAVVNRGRILQLGAPRDIYLRPQTEFVARFVGSTNLVYGRLRRSEGEAWQADVGWDKPLDCVVTTSLAPDREVAVSIRPEAIDLDHVGAAGASADGVNILRGEIGGAVFMGVNMRYEVRVADRNLSVVTNPRRMFAPGDQVALRFPRQSTIAVPRDA